LQYLCQHHEATHFFTPSATQIDEQRWNQILDTCLAAEYCYQHQDVVNSSDGNGAADNRTLALQLVHDCNAAMEHLQQLDRWNHRPLFQLARALYCGLHNTQGAYDILSLRLFTKAKGKSGNKVGKFYGVLWRFPCLSRYGSASAESVIH
jgi:hypothetical protein